MIDWLRPFLSRIISPLVAALAGWLVLKFGVNLDGDTQAQLVEAIVTVILPFAMIVNAVVHRLLDKAINPGDAASSHLAVSERHEATRMKARDR